MKARVHMTAGRPHETGDVRPVSPRQPTRRLRQERTHFAIQSLAVFGRATIMRGVDDGAPDLNDMITLLSFR